LHAAAIWRWMPLVESSSVIFPMYSDFLQVLLDIFVAGEELIEKSLPDAATV